MTRSTFRTAVVLGRGRAAAGRRHRRVGGGSARRRSRAGSATRRSGVAGATAASFPAADEDYFRDMDQTGTVRRADARGGARAATPGSSGRAGNDRMWDVLGETSVGALDFLKIAVVAPVAALQPGLRPDRLADGRCENRWEYLGLVNEPCFDKADRARSGPLGPVARPAVAPAARPIRSRTPPKYPGVAIGSRGKTLNGKPFETGSYYGYATGIVGLRLFPNPDFDERAAAGAGTRSATTPTRRTTTTRTLVRPYRVGMSCGFCHVGPNPIKPAGRSRTTRSGRTSARTSARSTSGSIGSSTEDADLLELRVPAVPLVAARARSTRRSSRPTTSTTRGR